MSGCFVLINLPLRFLMTYVMVKYDT
jgi:hypothetical protein